MKTSLILTVLLILSPVISIASGTSSDYFFLGLFLSVPSIIVIIILFFFNIKQSNLEQNKILKMGIVNICILIPFGVGLTTYGALIPNWAALKDGNYIAPIIYSIVINIVLLVVYQKKWTRYNKVNTVVLEEE